MRLVMLTGLLGTLLMLGTAVEGSKLLVLCSVGSKSHKNFFMGVVEAMAEKGHEITVVSGYKPSKEKANIREVVIPDMNIANLIPNFFKSYFIINMYHMVQSTTSKCVESLGSHEVQELLKEEFDLVLLSTFLNECYYSLIHHFKVPHVNLVPAGLTGEHYSMMTGNPNFPSFVPNRMLSLQYPLSFSQRAANIFADVTYYVVGLYYVLLAESKCRESGLCPPSMPPISEMKPNASLTIINNVQTMDTPARPYVQSVIHAGGIHCHPAKPLPQDLEEWVEGAGNEGFIFFSLGSALTPSQLPEEHRKILVKVFSSLPQRILWKWDEDSMVDLPSNVRLGKWLPQQDILSHPKLRLFITHGGLHSTLESIYHGAPLIGLPVFADQHSNMAEVQAQGWGLTMKWDELTEKNLKQNIVDVIHDEKMKKEVLRRSALMRDQPMSPAETAVYWLEYVIRHNGAPHLHCPAYDLTWYVRYNVDVWTLLTAMMMSALGLLVFFLRWCGQCLCPSSKKKRE